MSKTFTLCDLITHSYEEIEEEAAHDGWEKADSNAKPGKMAIRNILNYSKSLAVFHSKFVGTYVLIVN